MQQLRHAVTFIAACKGMRERLAMALWIAWFAVRRSIRPQRSAVKTLSFKGLSLCLDWQSSEHVPLREVLIRDEYWPEEAFRPAAGQTVVDVGANAGVYAVYAARRVGQRGRVVAIEPNPPVVARLERNARANGVQQVCTIVPVAVSNHAGVGSLMVGANSTISYLAAPGEAGLEVTVRSLDEIVRGVQLTDIDLMKIDVEGAEFAVLQGGRESLRRCRRIAIEVTDEATGDDISDALHDAGFDRVFRIGTGRGLCGSLVFGERRPH